MKPFHQHDCERCTYIGSGVYEGETVDVYKSCDASSDSHIIRFGEYGDYITTSTMQNEVDFQLITDKEQELIDSTKDLLNIARQERESLRTRISSLDSAIESLENKITYWMVSSEPRSKHDPAWLKKFNEASLTLEDWSEGMEESDKLVEKVSLGEILKRELDAG